jgi:hypothetical protein
MKIERSTNIFIVIPSMNEVPFTGGTPLEDWMTLALVHRHERDNLIHFDEPTHIYTIKGTNEGYCSITKLIHQFFGHFDPDAVITNMMRSQKWPKSKWYGMTREAIKAAWSANGRMASEAGTAVHLAIEMVMNGSPERIPKYIDDSPEMKYFWKYWKNHSATWEPWRTEWEVWDESLKLAGSIDMVYKHKTNGTYAIYDWKRTKEIKMENSWQSGLGPINHLPDCNLWHYTLQLNLYKWLLETHYGIVISELALIVLHPDNTSFKRYLLHSMKDEVEAMLACRRNALERGLGEVVHWEDVPNIKEGTAHCIMEDE